MQNFYKSLFLCTILLSGGTSLVLAQNYVAGSGAGTSLTTGYRSTFVGTNAGFNTTVGGDNTFLGFESGYSSTESYSNTFLGYTAGYSNITGSSNTFMGSGAGYSNENGHNNISIGVTCAFENISGLYNVSIGNGAARSNITGSSNTAIGTNAGHANLSSDNTFIGAFSGAENAGETGIGPRNTFVGAYSGILNIGMENTVVGCSSAVYNRGSYNSFFGFESGSENYGNYNTFIGYYAGRKNSTGSNNTFIGVNSGNKNTIGKQNTFVGENTGFNNLTGQENTALGFQAGYSNTSGTNNAFIGKSAGYYNTKGNANLFIGKSAGASNTTGDENTFIGYFANIPFSFDLNNVTVIGSKAYATTSNSVVIGSIAGFNGATVTANVGFGTTAPAYLLHVNGDAAKPGGGTWTVASDKNLKKNITDFKDGLNLLEKFHPVSFEYNGKADLPTGKKYVGVIAQEVKEFAPYMVGTFNYHDTTGKKEEYLDYDANALTYIAVNAIKEQQKMINELKEQVAEQKKEIENLKNAKGSSQNLTRMEAGNGSLGNNYPNPANTSTVIPYFVDENAKVAFIKIASILGQELETLSLPKKGNGEVTLSTQSYQTGAFIYTLYVDGKKADSKKLEVAK